MATVLGWDSETTLGYVKLLRNSDGAYTESSDHLALLDFLFTHGRLADYNVFWNVRFDFGAIVKTWVMAEAPRLKENHRHAVRLRKQMALVGAGAFVGDGKLSQEERHTLLDLEEELEGLESVERFDVGRYRIMYIPKKGFKITRVGDSGQAEGSVAFFDAMPFYATGIEEAAALGKMGLRYLGRGKSDEERGIDKGALGAEVGWYEAHRADVRA